MLNVSEAAVAVHGVDLVWSEQRVDTTLIWIGGSPILQHDVYTMCCYGFNKYLDKTCDGYKYKQVN